MPLMKGTKAKLLRCSVPIVIGTVWGKLADVLKQERKNISGMLRLAVAVQTFGHCIDFENSLVIDKGSFHVRKTLESWHTFANKHANNNSKLLPSRYSILF